VTAHLQDLAGRLGRHRVAVIGDVMLDHFLIGRVDRISPEAPVPVVRYERDEFRLGGAANVANNVVGLDGRVDIIGLVGDDDAGVELARQLAHAGIDGRGLVVDPARPTTRKMRIVTSRNQQVARVDRESDGDASDAARSALAARIGALAAEADTIVLSDYRKGVVTPDSIGAALAAARTRGVPVLVDPKVADVDRYRGTSLITPNHHEAELMTQTSIRTTDDARSAARRLHERTGANVLITWGEHGMWIFDANATPAVEQALPAVAREVSDVTGAGDTVIAVLALAIAAGAPLVDAGRLANIAAGLVVARFGPARVTPAELAESASALRM
jgi:D-beta-D-heptose 7-phosphate kinase/D-beta-D-heptose 1-phosphate adenosyltransferase